MAVGGALVVCVLSVLFFEGGSISLRAGDKLQVIQEDLSPNDSAPKKLFPFLEKGAKVKRETNGKAAVSGNVTFLQCGNSTSAECSTVNNTSNDQNSAASQLVGLEPAQREVVSNMLPCEYLFPFDDLCPFPTRHPIRTFHTRPHVTVPTRPPVTVPTRPPVTVPTRPPGTVPTRPPVTVTTHPMTRLTRPPVTFRWPTRRPPVTFRWPTRRPPYEPMFPELQN
ncbi:uncharacterized protein [Nothobranchius furzeri]|uniref:uncharacterized protein n=1 Tax=Nothobranchius furzeri TaxID=105023 RepID=UPI0024043D3C|nr:uncharacterized protein LOC129153090 [Nothobranchius furzeri]